MIAKRILSAQNMRLLTLILFVVLLLTSAGAAGALQISPSTPPPPPPSETPPEPAKPVFDPLHAEKNIEVGTFYMKKGNYDAAIDRFEDATRLQPSLAKPWRLMGEAYEKKHAYGRAVESYKKYLTVLPGAEDAAKVKKRIAMLEQKLAQEASKQPAH
jgi:tetratricopeptide (TPR) repeat protein